MERVDHGDVIVTERCGVVASEESTTSTTDVEQQQPLADGDALLKSFSPLLSSMKVFGLYFTQASRRIQDASASTSGTKDSQISRKWNVGRIYALAILVVAWLNAGGMLSVFEKTDKFGLVLLLKLAAISAGFLSAFQRTGCIVACQTGNLDRVFFDARLPKSDVARYRRLAVIHATVCWVFLLADVNIYLIPGFIMDNGMHSSMTPFGVHVATTDHMLVLRNVVSVLLFIMADSAWFFSYSVNYMITSVLYDQLRALNKDFHLAVGYRGEFQGSIRKFRRRHQELSQSVQNADQFMMISNVAGFFYQIVNVILILYCTIFFRDETVGQDAISAIMYVNWLVSTLCGLTLSACQGVAINHAVCLRLVAGANYVALSTD